MRVRTNEPDDAKGGETKLSNRTSIARDVYGKPRHDDDATQTGRKARARNLRVSRIDETSWCTECDRPMSVCPCERYEAKRVTHNDSVMEAKLYRTKKSREMFYRSKGRIA